MSKSSRLTTRTSPYRFSIPRNDIDATKSPDQLPPAEPTPLTLCQGLESSEQFNRNAVEANDTLSAFDHPPARSPGQTQREPQHAAPSCRGNSHAGQQVGIPSVGRTINATHCVMRMTGIDDVIQFDDEAARFEKPGQRIDTCSLSRWSQA